VIESAWMALLADETGSTKTLLEYIQAGGKLGYVLVALSFVALGLTILHFIQIRPSQLGPEDAVTEIEKLLRAGDVEGATRYCRTDERGSFLTRVMGQALGRCSRSSFGLLELRSALEEAGGKELDRLHRTTDSIGLIAAVGPMLGLLGTVFGMIGAFGSISALEGAARSRELAGFMALALINTAQGLAVAIPCTVLFAWFKRRIDTQAADVAVTIDDLAGLLEKKDEVAERTPRPSRPVARPAPSAASGESARRGQA